MKKFATIFETQRAFFLNFIEDCQDRFDLIIRNNVQVVFDENFIQFEDIVRVQSSIDCIMPKLVFLNNITDAAQLQLLKAIIDNYSEICSILRKYMMLFSHLSCNFINQYDSKNETFQQVRDDLTELLNNENVSIAGVRFYICSYENNDFYIRINNVGATRKAPVSISYEVINMETKEHRDLMQYFVEKGEFASDVGHQIVTGELTHLKNPKS